MGISDGSGKVEESSVVAQIMEFLVGIFMILLGLYGVYKVYYNDAMDAQHSYNNSVVLDVVAEDHNNNISSNNTTTTIQFVKKENFEETDDDIVFIHNNNSNRHCYHQDLFDCNTEEDHHNNIFVVDVEPTIVQHENSVCKNNNDHTLDNIEMIDIDIESKKHYLDNNNNKKEQN